jgi:hypothetical protein
MQRVGVYSAISKSTTIAFNDVSTSFMTFMVKTDYTKTTRYTTIDDKGGSFPELSPTISPLGLTSIVKSYTEVGNFVAGFYVDAAIDPKSVVFKFDNEIPKDIYVRGMWLEQTVNDTLLKIEFFRLLGSDSLSLEVNGIFRQQIIIQPIS